MKQGFKPLSRFQQKRFYGGYNWTPLLVTALPLILDTLTHIVSAVKIIGSNKGAIKYRGYESSWDDRTKSATKNTSNKISNKIQNHIYAY